MTILALEFSTEQRSVAVRHAGRLARAESASRAVGGLTLVEQALRDAGIEREAIECVAVGLGPGSYTGVRSAIAVAQGWQLAREVKLLGVSTVDCLAAQARDAALRGRVNFALDAQRSEFYLATYEIGDTEPRLVEPLRLVQREEVEQRAQAGELIAGPEVTRWFPKGKVLIPDAAVIAELAAGRNDFLPGDQLEPIYLREVSFVKAPPPRHL
jgi:tRNA threonylcarbamoyl adenosine modification protein YeaZ